MEVDSVAFFNKDLDEAKAMAIIVDIEASQTNPRVLCYLCWYSCSKVLLLPLILS